MCKDRICACIVLYQVCSILFNLICNMATFRKKKVLTFDPSPGVKGVCKDRIIFIMCLYGVICSNPFCKQHILGAEGSAGKIFACVIPLNLICNMTMF